MKYSKFDFRSCEKILTLNTEKCGTFEIYKGRPNIGRWYLVKEGRELAWTHFPLDGDFTMEKAEMWADSWYRNANKQVEKLDSRIADLQKEQRHIMFMLGEK